MVDDLMIYGLPGVKCLTVPQEFMMKEWNDYNIITVTPFEYPDEHLAAALHRSGAFSVLDIGHNADRGKAALKSLAGKIQGEFGIRIPSGITLTNGDIPDNASVIILTETADLKVYQGKKIIVQVTDVEGAIKAEKSGAWAVIAKGSESGGEIKAMSSFILFQQLLSMMNIPVFVQGGCGLHTAPAVLAAGGAGVVFDSQLSLLRESRVPDHLKEIIKRLDGTETKVVAGHRILSRPETPSTDDVRSPAGILEKYGELDVQKNYIPMGQDVAFAKTVFKFCRSSESFVFSIRESVYARIRQAKALTPFGAQSYFANEYNLSYPIAQGPMSSISDNPSFANVIANNGGLPFIALSTLSGERATELLDGTAEMLGNKPWGVGLLGFLPKELFSEQLGHIFKAKPDYALIAGGRPSQANTLEKAGIKCFLHVPTPGLLDLYLKEGARRFVFEGRECGGHIGPLSSFVLWEQQIQRLMAFDKPEEVSVLFAGGIHDALSSSMIAVMSASLVAKGVKVGILMGTSYLYTEEAVETGALLQRFQEKAVAESDTRILATAPGHETRCLDSRYADYFESEKARLAREKGEGEEVWQSLEQMNMGRLQIAARGVKWVDHSLIRVDETTQAEEGLYMIGQVASLTRSTTTVETLHKEVSKGSSRLLDAIEQPPYPKKSIPQVDIAIIGKACIFPGSPDAGAYWSNILNSRNLITEVPDTRWNKDIYFDPEAKNAESGLAGKKTNTKWGGFLPDCYFDPLDYGIPPQSLSSIDPVQLLSLQVSADALNDAGYGERDFDRENTSVIFGTEAGTDLAGAYGLRNIFPQYFGELPDELDAVLPTLTEDSFPGILGNVISGRIANRLDLGGRNYTVDAACASSMAALDTACRELSYGGSSMVIAGGADIHNSINDYLMFSSLYTLSSGRESKPFDSETDGLCMGEGVAAVVLKRYDDALNDGDRIYAVIKGMGGSSDGKSLGLTAPRKEGQVKALTRAYAQAGIAAADVGLIEAHGTGTVVGDKTELSSLTETFSNAGATPGTCALGTVKSQIGHAKCAAGMAGLIKSMMSVYHGILPPTINIKSTNAFYNDKTSPFEFSSMARPWLEEKRIAGISSFGFGGTNFHAVIKNCDNRQEPVFTSVDQWPAELVLIKGADADEAGKCIDAILELLSLRKDIRLRDIAYSLSLKQGPVFAAVVADSCDDLSNKLGDVKNGKKSPDIHYIKPVDGKVAFLFSGQGSQRPGMLADIFVTFPFLKKYLDKVEALIPLLYPPDAFSRETRAANSDAVKDTGNAQPLLGVCGMALAELLKTLGIEPDMLGGHSYGEIPALCYSGSIDVEDLVSVSKKRAEAILHSVDGDTGKMAAVFTDKETLEQVVRENPHVVVANHNSPKQSVIAGTSEGIEHSLDHLKTAGVTAKEIPVACAFHSPVIHRAEADFKRYLSGVTLKEPSIRVWSNTTAEPYPTSPDQIRERLAEHLVKPVRFSEQISAMEKDGAAVFIEVGPGNVLTGLVRDITGDRHRAFNTDQKGENGIRRFMTALAHYISTGRDIKADRLFEGRKVKALDLDNPDSFKHRPTVWTVNGHMCSPLSGNLPENAMVPVNTPFRLSGSGAPVSGMTGNSRDDTVRNYLDNVKEIMQAQRDVMLGYLGYSANDSFDVTQVPEANRENTGMNRVEPVEQTTMKPGKSVKDLLLGIVSEKTGYPPEMLDMTLDLEADLSIDSIKRIEIIGELNSQLGIEVRDDEGMQDAMEELAAIKTLEGIVAWLDEKGVGGDPANSLDQGPQLVDGLSRDEIQEALIHIVASKTGYPAEMLDLTLDLEADLSIDSIKRIEILGELNIRLSLVSEGEENSEEIMEELAAIKTLQGIIDWVFEKVAGEGNAGDSSDALPSGTVSEQDPSADNISLGIARYKAVLVNGPEPVMNGTVLSGRTFTLTGDTLGVADKVSKTLKEKGARVYLVNPAEDKILPEKTDGLIHLSPLSGKDDSCSATDLFDLVKQVDQETAQWVYGITGLGGDFGETSDVNEMLGAYQGVGGFIKSLSKEWRDTRCRYIDLSPEDQPEMLAEHIVTELLVEDTMCEIAYSKGARKIYNIHSEVLEIKENEAVSLNNDSVILALGGAKGITAEVVLKLADVYGCRFILVGRSELPEHDEDACFMGIESTTDLRKAVIAQGDLKKPSDIEKRVKKIQSERQLRKTIKSIEEKGGSCDYVSMDVSDGEAFKQLIQEVYSGYGRIDGVLHGAGVIEDKFVNQKSAASFSRVFTTKVNPAVVLSECIREDVQFVSFFSSIASAFGNKGQIDYSSANDTLDKLAVKMNNRINGRAFSINWGPWAGNGMVSDELSREYEKAGIGLIPADQGAEALVDEIRYGKPDDTRVIIMCGSPESMLLQGEIVND